MKVSVKIRLLSFCILASSTLSTATNHQPDMDASQQAVVSDQKQQQQSAVRRYGTKLLTVAASATGLGFLWRCSRSRPAVQPDAPQPSEGGAGAPSMLPQISDSHALVVAKPRPAAFTLRQDPSVEELKSFLEHDGDPLGDDCKRICQRFVDNDLYYKPNDYHKRIYPKNNNLFWFSFFTARNSGSCVTSHTRVPHLKLIWHTAKERCLAMVERERSLPTIEKLILAHMPNVLSDIILGYYGKGHNPYLGCLPLMFHEGTITAESDLWPTIVTLEDDHGNSALHHAAFLSSIVPPSPPSLHSPLMTSYVDVLADHKVNVFQENKEGMLPYACFEDVGNSYTIEAVLRKLYPIMISARLRQLEQGSLVNSRLDPDLLHAALTHGDRKERKSTVQRYVQHAPGIVNSPNRYGHYPIERVLKDIELVDIFVQAGADVNIQDKKGDTLLHRIDGRYHLDKGTANSLMHLIGLGKVDPEITNQEGKTALALFREHESELRVWAGETGVVHHNQGEHKERLATLQRVIQTLDCYQQGLSNGKKS